MACRQPDISLTGIWSCSRVFATKVVTRGGRVLRAADRRAVAGDRGRRGHDPAADRTGEGAAHHRGHAGAHRRPPAKHEGLPSAQAAGAGDGRGRQAPQHGLREGDQPPPLGHPQAALHLPLLGHHDLQGAEAAAREPHQPREGGGELQEPDREHPAAGERRVIYLIAGLAAHIGAPCL